MIYAYAWHILLSPSNLEPLLKKIRVRVVPPEQTTLKQRPTTTAGPQLRINTKADFFLTTPRQGGRTRGWAREMPSYRTKPMKSPRAIAPSPIGQIDQLPSPSPDTDQHLVTVLSLAQGLGIDFLPLTTLQFLSGPDIARAGRTNRFLYRVSLNEGLWQSARDALWEGKVCVSSEAKALPPRRAKDAYIQSLRDSTRTWLGQDELTTFSWWFRFKQQAGEAWTAQDPWYRNEKVGWIFSCLLSLVSCLL